MKKLAALILVFLGFLSLPTLIFASGPPSQSNSSYTAPSSSLPADGTTTGTISVHLEDSSGNNVTSDSISLSSSNDGTAVFNNSQTTDGSGNATFTITSTTAGTTNVTLTDNTNSATFTDWFTVTFYSATLGCSNVPAAPVLNSVTSTTDHTATLSWTDSANPVSNYLVSYGITSGKYVYGNPNVGGQGTTSTTIGSLMGDTKYYFVVAASNNCGASAFSNEMSVVAAPLPATPAPTPEPTIAPEVLPTTSDLVNPTDTPVDVTSDIMGSPTPIPTQETGTSTFKNLAIILIVSGIVVIGLIVVVQKGKGKKNSNIPPMIGGNTPQQLV
ncbi:MAG: fibronectin type III domain-containing protein [Candidatus Microgenomates bacterium]|jgi:hypothetical protein